MSALRWGIGEMRSLTWLLLLLGAEGLAAKRPSSTGTTAEAAPMIKATPKPKAAPPGGAKPGPFSSVGALIADQGKKAKFFALLQKVAGPPLRPHCTPLPLATLARSLALRPYVVILDSLTHLTPSQMREAKLNLKEPEAKRSEMRRALNGDIQKLLGDEIYQKYRQVDPP